MFTRSKHRQLSRLALLTTHKLRRYKPTFVWAVAIILLAGFIPPWMVVFQPESANATVPTNNDAMVVYDTRTAAGRRLYYRTWSGTAWGAEANNIGAPYDGQIRFNVVKYSPVANTAVLVTQTSTGSVDAQVWDGTIWDNWIHLGSVGSGVAAKRGFDVAYETSSGDAIVVYGDTTADPNYRIWNGSTWSDEANIDISTTGTPNWIQMESHPSTDVICMIVLDSAGDVFGSLWTGSAWDSDWDDTGANPDAVWDTASSQSTGTYQAIDVAYETATGDAMFAWGNDTQDQIIYRTYSGTTLSGDNTLTIAAADGMVAFLKLDRNRNAGRNDILLGESDAVSDLSTRRWSGTGWDSATEHPEHNAAIETATNRCWDIAWDYYSTNLNKAWIIYGDGTQASRKNMTIATGSDNWSAATTMLDDSDQINMVSSPGNGAILVVDNYNTGSASDDIYEVTRANDGATWSASSSMWSGATVNPGYEEADVAARLTGGNDGLLVFAKEAASAAWGASTLSVRTWTAGAWNAASTTALCPVRGDTRFIQLVFSSYRDEAILVTQNTYGEVDAQVFNGSTWGNYQRMNLYNADLDIEAGFDVAYEITTGDALVVYNNDSAADPAYRLWNGSTWGAETTIDIQTSAEPSWIKMDSKPGSDDIAMISIDTAEDVYGMYWDGSTWDDMNSGGTEGVWDTAASDDQYQPIDVAFENTSGDVMFAWGNTAANNSFRTYSAGSLSAVDTTNLDIAAAGGTARFVKLVADPSSGSDMILYGQNDSAADLNTRKWSGTAWDTATQHAEHSGTTEVATDRCFDIAWETYSGDAGKAWLMWGDGVTSDAVNIYTKEATVTAGTLAWDGAAGTLAADDTSSFQLIAQPSSGALLAMHYQATSSANDDIMETHITDGGTAWSAIAQIWAGPVVTVPTFMRVALAPELYIPREVIVSQDWRWYDAENTADPANDNGSDTTAGPSLANENVAPTSRRIIYSGNALKLRLKLAETGGLAGADNIKFRLQYDTSTGFAGATNVGESTSEITAWRYYNGSADSDNGAISNVRLSGTPTAGTHNESGTSASTFDISASTAYEFEFTIQMNPAMMMTPDTNWYFRAYYTSDSLTKAVPVDGGETYPSVTTASAYDLEVSAAPANVSYGASSGGSVHYVFDSSTEIIGFWDKRSTGTYSVTATHTDMAKGGDTIAKANISWTSLATVQTGVFASDKTGMTEQTGDDFGSTVTAYSADAASEGKGGFVFYPTIDIANLSGTPVGVYTGVITVVIV